MLNGVSLEVHSPIAGDDYCELLDLGTQRLGRNPGQFNADPLLQHGRGDHEITNNTSITSTSGGDINLGDAVLVLVIKSHNVLAKRAHGSELAKVVSRDIEKLDTKVF